MKARVLIAVSISSLLHAKTPAFAQGQPRPGQLPPSGGQAGPPRGQQAGPPPAAAAKPYKAVTISEPKPMNDPSFEAFRKQLGAVAEKKDRKGLAGLVSQTFFWMGEKGDKADKKKPGVDNLATAVGLEGKDAHGWDILGGAAADPTAMAYPDRKDTICAPSDPVFSAEEFEAVVKSTGTDESDWAYPTETGLAVHSGPQPNSPVVEKLGMHFVHVMQDANAQPGPMMKVVTPSGKTGFVPADSLNPLGNDQLCYSKEGGAWKISGFIGGDQ
jgi:hypothetical protein